MSGHAVFHPLRVAAIEQLTDDAVAVEFDVPPDLAEAYRFQPGQHITVRTPEAGDDERRNYSICSTDRLRVGVKRLPGGGFSSYAIDRMRVGDVVDVMTPTGRFCTTPDPSARRHIACVAAGSGITPIIAIVSGILAAEPKSEVTLVYGNRAVSSVMFLEEIADLKDVHPDRFRVVHVLSREQPDIDLLAGRIDKEKLTRLVPPGSVDEWYLCGPLDMVTELRTALRNDGVPANRVHSELFHVGKTPPPRRSEAAAAPAAGAAGAAGAAVVTAILDGRRSTFSLDRQGVPVLEGVLGVRSDAPFACRGGVCGTCRAKVLEGTVEMEQCYALEPDEVERGYVLTCQSHPTTEKLVVDYDA